MKVNLKKLLSILHKWKPHYASAALLLLLSAFFRMLEPKVLQVAIDGVLVFFQNKGEVAPAANDVIAKSIYQILPALRLDNLGWVLISLGLIYLAIAFVRGVSRFSSSILSASATEKSIKRLRDNLFSHIQLLSLESHSKISTGEMIQRSTGDVDTIRSFLSEQVTGIVLMTGIFGFSFVMMYMIHPSYALIAVSLVPFILLTSVYFFSKEGKIWKKHEEEQDKLTSIAEENLAGIRVVQAFAKEKHEMQRFDNQNLSTLKIGIRHVNLHAIFWPISDSLIHSQIVLSILAGGYFTLTNQITVGELTAFYTYAIMVTWPMRQLGRIVSQLSMVMVAITRLSEILDTPTEDYQGLDQADIKGFKGDIEFRNVWFKYKADDEEFVLKDISFKVNAGEKIALLGPTGSGKSTLIKLFTRFYEPTKGEIFIDGIPITHFSKKYLRQKIGVVLQKPFLFSTSIKQNIAYTNAKADDAAIYEVAKAASIHEIMDIFSDGYDTMVGEKGVTLSGGQKQRVALARTLLESPDILVLDDTTSAVDTETEYDIQQALATYMKDKTTFIIAHRITAIQGVDRVLVLENGAIVERGTQEELQKSGGFYQKIYDVQTAMEMDII